MGLVAAGWLLAVAGHDRQQPDLRLAADLCQHVLRHRHPDLPGLAFRLAHRRAVLRHALRKGAAARPPGHLARPRAAGVPHRFVYATPPARARPGAEAALGSRVGIAPLMLIVGGNEMLIGDNMRFASNAQVAS